jgi:hypothetical protein
VASGHQVRTLIASSKPDNLAWKDTALASVSRYRGRRLSLGCKDACARRSTPSSFDSCERKASCAIPCRDMSCCSCVRGIATEGFDGWARFDTAACTAFTPRRIETADQRAVAFSASSGAS